MTGEISRSRLSLHVTALLIFAFAVLLRVGLLNAPGEFDEFYHLLAARGLVDSGLPRILDGEYWRGALFTRMVAGLFRLTGSDDLPVARVISVIAGSLIPVVVFLWISKVVGTGTAALATAFTIFWPQGILESQLARFYALHVLTFLLGAVAFYLLVAGGVSSRLIYAALTALGWTLAIHFQISAVIGIGAACLGGIFVLVMRERINPVATLLLLSPLIVLGVIAAVALDAASVVARAWEFYRWTPVHSEHLRNYYAFYFQQFETWYGLLWFASLALVPLGLRANQTLAVYCATIFVLCFLAHSFGGMKSLRYMSYATPFLFVNWALGIRVLVGDLTRRFSPRTRNTVIILSGILVVVATLFVPRSLQLASGEGLPDRGDWSDGAGIVGEWLEESPFIVTTRELHQIAYLGDYDVLFSESRQSELSPPEDFGVDPRTGRPVVGTEQNMMLVIRCAPDGLLVTSPDWWYDAGFNERLGRQMDAEGILFDIREGDAIVAIRWHHDDNTPAACETLPRTLRTTPPEDVIP